MLTKQHQLLNRLESEQPFHASLLTYYCKICFDLQDISSLSWSYFVMSNKFACPNVGYKQLSILSHCNNAKFKAWFKKTSEIKVSCYTAWQAYVTPLIYNNIVLSQETGVDCIYILFFLDPRTISEAQAVVIYSDEEKG